MNFKSFKAALGQAVATGTSYAKDLSTQVRAQDLHVMQSLPHHLQDPRAWCCFHHIFQRLNYTCLSAASYALFFEALLPRWAPQYGSNARTTVMRCGRATMHDVRCSGRNTGKQAVPSH